MEEMYAVYVLKDQNNKYVGDNSIWCDKQTGEYFYSCSETLSHDKYVNPFKIYTYPTKNQASEGLNTLRGLANKLNFAMDFHIEKIDDLMMVLLSESKLIAKRFNKICLGRERAVFTA